MLAFTVSSNSETSLATTESALEMAAQANEQRRSSSAHHKRVSVEQKTAHVRISA